MQVGLDGGSKLIAGPPELAHRATEHTAELRELRWAEHQEGDDADDEHLLESNVEHEVRVSRVTQRPAGARPHEPITATWKVFSIRILESAPGVAVDRGVSSGDAEARPLLAWCENMIVLRVALNLLLLSVVAVRERLASAMRGAR